MNELLKTLKNLALEIAEITSKLDLPQKHQAILELEDKMQESGFWEDLANAQKISQEYDRKKRFYDFWKQLPEKCEELIGLIESNEDESAETVDFLEDQVRLLKKSFDDNQLSLLLNGQYDNRGAVVSIHAGAGGSDAQDWADILLRMYLRYAEKQGLKTEMIEFTKGQEAGIKSATFQVNGEYSYGLFRSEAGVHRLVRLSPFNPAHTRETSFAQLEVLPVLEEQEAINLKPEDLKIEATTSSGHGGQSVNTTYSAIRITHIPSGLKVSIQNERSQHQNKEIAMKILTAKVQALADAERDKQKQQLKGEYKSAEWGNQIRSYVIHPYKLVKDHRTNYEQTDPDQVFDGELSEFVQKFLEQQLK